MDVPLEGLPDSLRLELLNSAKLSFGISCGIRRKVETGKEDQVAELGS